MDFVGYSSQKESVSLENSFVPIERESNQELRGREAQLAGSFPNIYAGVKAVSSVVPFMYALFPSGRDEFGEKSIGEKALSLGLDTATVIPAAYLFKGAKSIIQSGVIGKWLGGKAVKPWKSLSVLEDTIPTGSRWETRSLLEKVRSTWKLPEDEAKALIQRNAKPELWKAVPGPSGAFIPRKASPKFQKLFEKGELSSSAAKQLDYWQNTSLVKQRRDFYKAKWEEKLLSMSGGGKPDLQNMFNHQVGRFVGEKAEGFLLENASSKVMANLLTDMIDHPKSVLKQLDIGYHWLVPTALLPIRKGVGGGEKAFGTYSMFEKLKGAFKDANEYELQLYTNFVIQLADRGFGTLVKTKYGGKEIISGFKRSKEFTKEVWEDYGKTAVELDRLKSTGAEEIEIANYLRSKPDIIQRLMTEVHKPFHDDLYKDYALTRIPQVLADKNLSEEGFREFAKIWEGDQGNGLAKVLSSILNPDADLKAATVLEKVGTALDLVKVSMKPTWFAERKPEVLAKDLEEIKKALSFSKRNEVGFLNYIDNYTIRLSKTAHDVTNQRLSLIGKAPHAAFVKTRLQEEASDIISDPARLLQARIGGQARELWLYPYLGEELKKMPNLPEGYKTYFDYWLGRMLGQPTAVDAKVAQWLTNSIGGLSKLFGKNEVWTSRRVNELAYKINDIVYKGALSFRPFAAVRNSFQPFLTVPTDMGGIKDTYWLLRGYKRGLAKETQEYMQSKGMIGDYLEELKPGTILPSFSSTIKGKEVPSLKPLWDVGMWLFKGSDRFTRYTAGGAALSKWDHYLAKYLTPKNYQPKTFAKKMNFHLRDDWVRRQLDEVMERLPKAPTSQQEIDAIANIAKDKFVTDVVGDTQWLYGIADSPLITSKFGVISKTGAIFQTWWMNYITQLESWFLKRGTPGDKIDRFFTWMASSAIAGELMVHGAGFRGSQARATILGGPMPTEVSPMLIPPTWAPLYYALGSAAELAKLSPDLAKQRLKSLGRSLTLAVPGGIIGGQAIRGYQKDKWEGLARGIFNYYGGTGETLLKE
jgi:hemerythrin superfamily protein